MYKCQMNMHYMNQHINMTKRLIDLNLMKYMNLKLDNICHRYIFDQGLHLHTMKLNTLKKLQIIIFKILLQNRIAKKLFILVKNLSMYQDKPRYNCKHMCMHLNSQQSNQLDIHLYSTCHRYIVYLDQNCMWALCTFMLMKEINLDPNNTKKYASFLLCYFN